jgi:hypothetical protein
METVSAEKPYVYKMVFFGADREYGPEEGWQTVRRKRRYRKKLHVIPNLSDLETDN